MTVSQRSKALWLCEASGSELSQLPRIFDIGNSCSTLLCFTLLSLEYNVLSRNHKCTTQEHSCMRRGQTIGAHTHILFGRSLAGDEVNPAGLSRTFISESGI